MNTRILENIEDQFSARSGARMLTEEEMDAIAGGELIWEVKQGTLYVNQEAMRRYFLNDRTGYERLVKWCETWKAGGSKVGTLKTYSFSRPEYLDTPPAYYGEQGISGN